MKKLIFIHFCLFFCIYANAQTTVPLSQVQPNLFAYTLPYNCKTVSKSIFLNGVSVRSIPPDQEAAGSHYYPWDGKDDLGNNLTIGLNYQLKVLANNLVYTWEGVIGNNSTNLTGLTSWAEYGSTLSDMVNVGSYMYTTLSFTEYAGGQIKFNVSTPNQQTNLFPFGRIGQCGLFMCANATTVFYGGNSYTHSHNYVIGTKVSNDALQTFSSGVVENPAPATGGTYASVLDLNTLGATGIISGMAVQQSGSQYLYVAHAAQNIINVYQTSGNTGPFVRSISITNPTNLCFEGDGTLWIAQGTTVTKYTVNTNGTITATGSQITGFARVAGLDVLSGDLCVLDAGNQQIVKRYNSTTLASTGTIGQVGGYSTSPTVANNKFYEEDQAGIYSTFVRHQSDGSIWVCDPGNCRYQHFNSSGTYLNNIMFLKQQYNCNVVLNQPTQVFSDYLEYTIDYSRPLASGWILTNNWGYNQPIAMNTVLPINDVILMSNSRRYGVFRAATNNYYMGELTSTGVRYITGTILPSNPRLDTIGNLYVDNGSGSYPNQSIIYQKYTLTGFNGSGNPTYSSASTITTVPLGANSAVGTTGSHTVTASGNVIIFNPGSATHGGGANKLFHLSGYNIAGSKMIFKSAPETFTAYNGIYPLDGAFDIGNGVSQGGSEANAVGNNIFWGYHGEFWKASETGIIEQFNDQGLYMGQMGTVGPAVANQYAAPLYAGNSLNVKPVAVGDSIFIYASDEKHHSGLHRWKVTGLNTIYNQTSVAVPLTNRVFTPTVNTTDLLLNYPNGWTQTLPDYNNSTSDFLSTTIGTCNYILGSTPTLQFWSKHIGSGVIYYKKRVLPSSQATNLDIKGELDVSNGSTFQSSKTSVQKFYIDVLDNTNKVIVHLIGYSDLTFQINGTSYNVAGPLLSSTVGYGNSKFVIKKWSSTQVYVYINLFGHDISGIYTKVDPASDLNNAAYISWNWLFAGTNIGGARFGINSLYAVQ